MHQRAKLNMQAAEQTQVEEETSTPLFKKRGPKKSTIRKRPATPVSEDSTSSGFSSSDDEKEGGRPSKRPRKAGIITASSATKASGATQDLEASTFAADRSARIEPTNDATKHSNWYDQADEAALDAKALLGSTRTAPASKPAAEANGAYKGATSYQTFIQKNANAPTKQVGPIKAPTNVRTITVTDYSPDVCKDYKQTGFCGFGDNCKFLHAREDYKQGWQLDREWENVTKGKKVEGGKVVSSRRRKDGEAEAEDSDDEAAALEGIPFACIICKEAYKNPIVTKCGHYFCEACALKRFRKTPSCAACGAGTGGVFNSAKNLRKLLDKKREREKEREKEMSEAEED